MTDLVGFIGGFLFAMSAIPLAWSSLKTKKTDMPWLSICLIGGGASCFLVYGSLLDLVPLIADMCITASCWCIIGFVKWRSENV